MSPIAPAFLLPAPLPRARAANASPCRRRRRVVRRPRVCAPPRACIDAANLSPADASPPAPAPAPVPAPAPLPVYFATCARGLGQVLAAELRAPPISADVLHVASSGVRFRAARPGHATAYRACLWLRTAIRVLFEVAHDHYLPDRHPDPPTAVYHFVKSAADWPALLPDPHNSFSVQTRVSDEHAAPRPQHGHRRHAPSAAAAAFPAIGEHTLQVRAKDAVCDALRDAGLPKPPRPPSHADAHLPLFIKLHGPSVTLYLDMAGASLHKRGYRSDTALHRSSLNESVAAGMLYLAGFRPDGSFVNARPAGNPARPDPAPSAAAPRALTVVDPMCGSATLLIEAALLRLRVAPGLYRARFAFQAWPDFDPALFQSLVQEAVSMQRPDDDIAARFIGNDVNPAALRLARRDLERVRLSHAITLHHADARDLALPAPPTLTISNPPWGRRIHGEVDAWHAMGEFLREHAPGSVAVFLSGDAAVTRGLRMKARQKTPVRIGNVDTRVLVYDVLPKKGDGMEREDDQPSQRRRGLGDGQRRAPKLSEREMPIL